MIDLEFVRGLIDAVDQSNIDSLEITRAGTSIRVAKTPPAATVTAAAPQAAAPQVAAPTPAPGAAAPAPAAPTGAEAEAAAGAEAAEAAEAEGKEDWVDVTSPMVGTFYRAPAPDAPPYVEVGNRVATGQTLCILEAMKLMNELESEVEGVVKEILVENAEPVEYGQVLFRIDPTG